VLLLAEDQSGYVASILRRLARLPGLMWDLDNTRLLGTMSHSLPSELGSGYLMPFQRARSSPAGSSTAPMVSPRRPVVRRAMS